jgi:hypothetical protein
MLGWGVLREAAGASHRTWCCQAAILVCGEDELDAMESKLLPVYRILAELWLAGTILAFFIVRILGSATFKHIFRLLRGTN